MNLTRSQVSVGRLIVFAISLSVGAVTAVQAQWTRSYNSQHHVAFQNDPVGNHRHLQIQNFLGIGFHRSERTQVNLSVFHRYYEVSNLEVAGNPYESHKLGIDANYQYYFPIRNRFFIGHGLGIDLYFGNELKRLFTSISQTAGRADLVGGRLYNQVLIGGYLDKNKRYSLAFVSDLLELQHQMEYTGSSRINETEFNMAPAIRIGFAFRYVMKSATN